MVRTLARLSARAVDSAITLHLKCPKVTHESVYEVKRPSNQDRIITREPAEG